MRSYKQKRRLDTWADAAVLGNESQHSYGTE